MTKAEVIIHNLQTLIEQAQEKDEVFWEDEYGSVLTWGIGCHPVFKDSTPCLNNERKSKYGSEEFAENCVECKARWLLEEYEE